MRKLISLFRKFLSTSSLFSRDNLSFTLIVTAIAFGASCQLARKSLDDSKNVPDDSDSSLTVTPPLAPVALVDSTNSERFDLIVKQGTDDFLIANVINPECDTATPSVMNMELSIKSAFGTHRASLAIRGDDSTETVRASIDSANMGFSSASPIKSRVIGKVCAARLAGKTRVEVTRDTFDQVREYIESVAPDCEKITTKKSGWFCQVPAADPESAKQELIGVRTTMIRRWSRQPYLLARRLAIGIQIANALQADQVEKELDTFCKIVKENLPQEIPVVMTSLRWQNALCDKESEHRVEAAMFGLIKTISEVDFMRQIFESTSKLGTLTIRVGRDVSPSGQFFVQLKPNANVNGNLTAASMKLLKTEASADDGQRACWHPLFVESPHLMELARNLAMAGDSTKAICDKQRSTPATEEYAERYLADSITSETEFVISNGRSKLLRLPTGAYNYTLHALPENPDEWDDASLSTTPSTGTIEWSPSKPRPVINTWGG